MDPARTQIGKYRVIAVLGQGGMGIVYKAEDSEIRRQVAIKMILAPMVDEPDLVNRFYDEVRVTANLHHPNIVTVYDWGKEEGNPYIVMEFLDGLSLDKVRIKVANQQLLLYQQIDVVIQVCAGLQHAHNNAVIHRDIKPANVVMLKDKTVKLVDFGIARLCDSSITRAGVTRDGQIIGSLEYMSPEQLEGASIDHRTDVYSSGVVLYRLLTETLPFHGTDVTSTITKILHSKPRPLSDYLSAYPPELDEILGRAMAKHRAERFQSADEFALELASVQSKLKRSFAAEYIAKAEACLERSDWATAKSQLLELLNIDRGHERANELLREIQQILRRDQRLAEANGLKSQAEQEFAHRNYEEALSLMEQAVRLDDTDLGLRMFRDQVREAKERSDKSHRALTRAESLVEAEELEDALIAASEALALEPEQTKAREIHQLITRRIADRSRRYQIESVLQEARKEIVARRFTSALELLKRAAAIEPGRPEIQELHQAALRGREQERRRSELERITTEAQELAAQRRFDPALANVERGLRESPNDTGLLALKESIEKQRIAEERRNRAANRLRSAYQLMESGDFSSAIQVLESAVAESPSDTNLKASLEQALALQALRQKETEELDRIREEEAQIRKYEADLERQRRDSELQQQQTEARLAIERQQAELESRRKQADARRLEHQAEIERQDAELARQRKEVESKLRQRLEEDARRKQEVESVTPEQPQAEGEASESEPAAIEPLQATVIVASAPAPAPVAQAEPAASSSQATKIYKVEPEPRVKTAAPVTTEEPAEPRPRVPIRTVTIAAAALVLVATAAFLVKRWWDHRPPPPAQQFVVKIESTPPHAHIQIKGLNITCETPCEDLRLAPGRYEMEATLEQYQPSNQAVQVPEQAAGVRFSLNPLPPVELPAKLGLPVNLTIRTSPGATVTVDDKPYKTKSDGTVKAEVASNSPHAVHVQKDGFKAVDQNVSVTGKNMELPIRLEAMPDAVTILVKKAPPAASVLVDGSSKATVAKDGTAKFQVPSGTHSFALSTSSGTAAAVSRSSKTGEKLVLDNLPLPVVAAKPPVDTTDADWNRVKDSNNVAELQGFVDRHSASPYADSAKNKIDQLDWNSASSSGKPQDYLAKHPNGQFVQQGRDELDSLAWKDVQGTGDIAKLQEFIDQHPKSKYRSAATDKIASLTPKPAATAHAADDDSGLIKKVLGIYQRAYQDKNKVNLRRVRPALTDKEYDNLTKSFRDAESIQIALKIKQGPVIEGDSAQVTCDQLIKVKVQGATQSIPSTAVFTLKKDEATGWYIEKVVTSK
jgi:tRNA A-37 threonylcarbamoyl transferase component Bud32